MNLRLPLLAGLVLVCATLTTSAQTLLEKRFQVAHEAEVLLDLTANALNTSWREKGREAAAVTIFVDGRYHQDLLLFNGAGSFSYQLLLGRLQAGEHTLRIDFNRQQSAPQATTINVQDAKLITVDSSQPEFQALAHAPILFARPNTIGKFSDVPLLAYYETLRKGANTLLRYTVIFSNEDGGTQTSGLMARWGRTTDIEYVCEIELDAQGHALKTIFQGVNHKDTEFRGQYEADHPLFFTASDNNNFAENQTSTVRFAPRPLPFDLSQASREEVMDRHPWTYRVMAEEMLREEKITTQRAVGRLIADLRRYLFIDASSEQRGSAAISFAVKLKGDPHWYPSDWGINGFKIERSGYMRSTVLLPVGTKLSAVEKIEARCDVFGQSREAAKLDESSCEFKGLNKIFMLDESYQPDKPLLLQPQAVKLKFGEAMEFNIAK